MLLDSYEQKGLLFNMNYKESAGEAGKIGYRGELVLVEGEVGDASGRRKPPQEIVRGAAALEVDGKLAMVMGQVDDLKQLEIFMDMYGADVAPSASALFFVVNIKGPMKTELRGLSMTLVPLQDGMVWNEAVAELKLEKGDFKGQSSGEKVLTLANGFADYTPKYPQKSWAEAVAAIDTSLVRESRGPV